MRLPPVPAVARAATNATGRSVAQRTVVTVAFDTFKLLRPVFHGDFVRLEGRALSINASSIVCQASVYRRDFATGEFQLTHNAIVTFVALDKRGRPSGGLPELFDPQRPEQCQQLRDLATKRRELSTRWRKAQEEVTALAAAQPITHDMIPVLDSDGAALARKVNIQDTVIETRNNFLLKHANLNRNVFGGVLLDWMVRWTTSDAFLAQVHGTDAASAADRTAPRFTARGISPRTTTW